MERASTNCLRHDKSQLSGEYYYWGHALIHQTLLNNSKEVPQHPVNTLPLAYKPLPPPFSQSPCTLIFLSRQLSLPLQSYSGYEIQLCECLSLQKPDIMSYQSLLCHFSPSNSQQKYRVACTCGDRRSAMVVTRKYHDPAHKPPPLSCLMLVCRKGSVYLWDSTVCTYKKNMHLISAHMYLLTRLYGMDISCQQQAISSGIHTFSESLQLIRAFCKGVVHTKSHLS